MTVVFLYFIFAMHKILSLFFAFCITVGISSCFNTQQNSTPVEEHKIDSFFLQVEKQKKDTVKETAQIDEFGVYTDKKNVSLYIHTFNRLPDNYITKAEAQKLGWDNQKGNLADVAPGKSIGGDRFGNYEGLLPKDKQLRYFECDIDYKKGKRNAKRIIYSNQGTIYYTKDHYKTFEQLY